MGLKEQVREKYGQAALRVKTGGSSCCGASAALDGCCDPITSNLYDASADRRTAARSGARLARLRQSDRAGPTQAGETVLDLGSGGGIDVLLSARRVGPAGKAYGLDMTDEMLALARENQRKAGVENVEFLKGEIENIPLPDNSVDVIISQLRHQPVGRQGPRVARGVPRAEAGRPVCRFRRRRRAAKCRPRCGKAWSFGSAASPVRSKITRYTSSSGQGGFRCNRRRTHARLQHRRCAAIPDRRRHRRGRHRAAGRGQVHERLCARGRETCARQDVLVARRAVAESARNGASCWRRSSGPASWATGSAAATSRLRCSRIRWRRAPRSCADSHFRRRSRALISTLPSRSRTRARAECAGATCRAISRRKSPARLLGVCGCSSDVREPCLAVSQHVRAGGAQLFSEFIATFGLLSVIWGCGRLRVVRRAVRCRALHYRRVLVHGLHLVRESRRDAWPAPLHEYVRRHPARRCSGLHRRPACGRVRRHVPFPMAGAVASQTGSGRCSASQREGTFAWQIRNECSFCAREIRREPDGRRPVAARRGRPLRGSQRRHKAEPGPAGSDRGHERTGHRHFRPSLQERR